MEAKKSEKDKRVEASEMANGRWQIAKANGTAKGASQACALFVLQFAGSCHTRFSMKLRVVLILLLLSMSGLAEELAGRYAEYGELMVAEFASAPFPHPKRAEGHTYKGQLYST